MIITLIDSNRENKRNRSLAPLISMKVSNECVMRIKGARPRSGATKKHLVTQSASETLQASKFLPAKRELKI